MSEHETGDETFTIHKPETFKNFSGRMNIPVSVKGYWSNSSIEITISRDHWGDEDGMNYSVSHSTGGRDNKEVPSDVAAALNFGYAMIAAVEYAKELKEQEEFLISEHDKFKEAARKRQAKEAAARQAIIDADSLIGYDGAVAISLLMRAKANESCGTPVRRKFRMRGSDRTVMYQVYSTGRMTQFFTCVTPCRGNFEGRGSRVPLKEFIDTISTMAEIS